MHQKVEVNTTPSTQWTRKKPENYILLILISLIYLGLDKNVGSMGITLELCAGIVDKEGKSLCEIAKEEVEEECGYRVESNQIEFIQRFRASIGTGKN